MTFRARRHEVDMLNGSVFRKILLFSYPLVITNVLQLLYNAADVAVVGHFAGKASLAAVGSTSALINLLINLFMGLSIGASVCVARHFGAERHKDVSIATHTTITIAFICSVFVGAIGAIFARPLLEMMECPDDVIDLATLYMRIYFLGMPGNMVYTFGAAILRAVGDTRRPLFFLTVSGVINVALNLLFVITFKMDVAGVALATIISQLVSAVLIVLSLLHSHGSVKLMPRELRINKEKLMEIAKVGLPAGLQSSLFSISNVLIQSSINSFNSAIVSAGNAAAQNLEGFTYAGMISLQHAALSFTSQNIGAGKYERVPKIMWTSVMMVSTVGVVMGVLTWSFGGTLLKIYSTDPEVISVGMVRLLWVCLPYLLCGVMDVMVGVLRGMGCSLLPMSVTIVGVCVLRIVWIYTVFAASRRLEMLYLSYPVSWFVTGMVHLASYFYVKRKRIDPYIVPS